jgi:DNA replication licensing factor MCM7
VLIDSDIGKLVKVKGLVTRASDVKPRVTVCTYTCDICAGEIFVAITGPQYMPLQTCPSQKCKDNKTTGRITQIMRGSHFTKYQELRLQELPDQVPVGHIPRSMIVHCRCGAGLVVYS